MSQQLGAPSAVHIAAHGGLGGGGWERREENSLQSPRRSTAPLHAVIACLTEPLATPGDSSQPWGTALWPPASMSEDGIKSRHQRAGFLWKLPMSK